MEAVQLVRRFYAEIWNDGDLDSIPDICHEGIVFRGSLGDSKVGHQGFADYVRYVRGALGGYRCHIEDTVCEGERVFAKMSFAGLHEGEFQGYAPTGKMLEWTGADLDVVLEPTGNPLVAKLTIKDTTWYRNFVQLHKAKGGVAFKVYAALLAVALFIILLSGFIMSLQVPKLKKQALVTSACGLLAFALVFAIS